MSEVKKPHIFRLMERFGKDRILRAYSKRRFRNKRRSEYRKTGQKHMDFHTGGMARARGSGLAIRGTKFEGIF